MIQNLFSNYFYLINQIPKDTLILIISLPILATICAFLRQIIGIRLFILNLVLIFSYLFYFLEIKIGLVLAFFILFSLTFFRLGIKKLQILYLSRIAILFTFVALLFFSLYFLSVFLKINMLFVISPLLLILIIILSEKFISDQIKNPKDAWIETFEVFIIALIFYFILKWEMFQIFIINYAIFIFIFLFIINIILGKWTGLRLNEYLRFREAFKYVKFSQKK